MSNYWERRLHRRSVLRYGALTGSAVATAALVGCGDDDGDATASPAGTSSPGGTSSPSGSSAATRTATATAQTGTPKDGQVYSAYVGLTGSTLDLHRELYSGIAYTAGQAYDNIVAWDDIEKGTIRGEIAKSLPEQPDQTTYIFTLRDNVKWQNKAPANGRALTMDDIKWNIERQRAQKLASGEATTNFYRYTTVYGAIDSVQYTDATRFTVKLKAPSPLWLGTMCEQFNVVMYKEIAEQIEQNFAVFDPKYILCTGPYIIDEYSPKQRAHGVRNPDYFLKKEGQQVQFFDGVAFNDVGADRNAQRTAFEQKQLDILSVLNDQAKAIQGAHSEVKLTQVPVPDNNLEIKYNYESKAFSNANIRKAVFLAVDRTLCGQQYYQGLARPNPLVPWGFTEWSLPQSELATAPGYRNPKDQDLKDAKAAWAAGGGDALDASEFNFTIIDAGDQSLKEWWVAMMNRNLGTDKFSLTTIPAASLLQYLVGRQGPGYLGAWTLWNSPDPRRQVANYYLTGGSQNFYRHSDPQMDGLINSALAEFDRPKAIDTIKQVQRLALQDGGGGHFHMVGGLNSYVYWPYLHREGPTFITYEKQIGRRSWIDTADPSFNGRPKVS